MAKTNRCVESIMESWEVREGKTEFLVKLGYRIPSTATNKSQNLDNIILFQRRIKPIQVHYKSSIFPYHNVRPKSSIVAIENLPTPFLGIAKNI